MGERWYVFKRDEFLVPGKVWVAAEMNDGPATEWLMPRLCAGIYTRAQAEADPILADALAAWDRADDSAHDERERRWTAYADECDRLEGEYVTARAAGVSVLYSLDEVESLAAAVARAVVA